MFKRAAPSAGPAATPNPADPQNGLNDGRRKRLVSGGRNSTFLAQTQAAAIADRSPATLSGLSGTVRGNPAGGGV